MDFYNISKEKLNSTVTENGDKCYFTSNSACLDLFGLVGGMRNNMEDCLWLFKEAVEEDPITAIKILFYNRDIRGGLGERKTSRYMLNALGKSHPELAVKLIPYIPEYGRYDDLLALLDTPCQEAVVKLISEVLNSDLALKEENKSYSLLAKWLPSANTSSKETRAQARELAKCLGYTLPEYRKVLSELRSGLIIENNLRTKDYSFPYESVPGCAMFKYKKAFNRNDEERFGEYMAAVHNGKAKINTQILYPYQIVREALFAKGEEAENLNTMWDSLRGESINSKTIVVRDGSGSMTCPNGGIRPLDIATSLAILFAEKLEGAFHNKFITFSERPRLVELKGETIQDKVRYVDHFDDCENTDIEKVYDLILDVYKDPGFTKEDELDRIVIISDMEFDYCANNSSASTFEYFKEEFQKLGCEMPKLVFWNVAARRFHTPVKMNENGVCLVSGSSQNVITTVETNEIKSPYQYMLDAVNKYSFVDTLFSQQ